MSPPHPINLLHPAPAPIICIIERLFFWIIRLSPGNGFEMTYYVLKPVSFDTSGSWASSHSPVLPFWAQGHTELEGGGSKVQLCLVSLRILDLHVYAAYEAWETQGVAWQKQIQIFSEDVYSQPRPNRIPSWILAHNPKFKKTHQSEWKQISNIKLDIQDFGYWNCQAQCKVNVFSV